MEDHEKTRTKMLADLDQAAALMAETIPPTLRSFHVKLVGSGFTEDQALVLTRDLLLKLIGGGS